MEDATVHQADVLGYWGHLEAFLQRYLPLFHRRERRKHARLVIGGRLGGLECKTSEPIARAAGWSASRCSFS